MNTPHSETTFRAGFAAIVGRPNVGKSTLMNSLLGQKVAAVSARPQTTRRRQLGILTLENAQIIFLDTPGLHNPHHKLGEYMCQVAIAALQDADVIVWLVDAGVLPQEEDRLLADLLKPAAQRSPVILALNKADRMKENPAQFLAAYQALLPSAIPLFLSASEAVGLHELLEEIVARLPAGKPYYDPELVTDLYEREIAADLVREAALHHLRDEIPHSIVVRIDEFTERGEKGAYIAATLLVEKDSQKGIVIGKGGGMLKKIGSHARREIEAMSGRKVFLELRVKVSKNWRNNPDALRLYGFTLEK